MRLYSFFAKIKKDDWKESTFTSGVMVSEADLPLEKDKEAVRQDIIKSFTEDGYMISKDITIEEVQVDGYEISIKKLE
ncbi:hypothetical protein [Guptibacillus spartinae]|uniref:hypothetical protein n=1 Tax=Guptibacillus spartinae TaxID=3025679 RepID=UPI00235F4592|nr:hypothetical protein [Pseudalkalibacillus spartinae]